MAHLNAALLAKLQQYLLSHPGAFNIEDFDSDLAGLAVAAAGIDPRAVDAYPTARRLLRVRRVQLDALAFVHHWPHRFREGFDAEPTNRRQVRKNARLAAARVAYFAAVGR